MFSEICEAFFAVVSLTLGIALGVPIGLLFSLGAILITLVRFPINFVQTYKVVILTVVFKRRLKLLVLIALTIVHIIYPIIASVLVVSGSVIILSGIFSYKIFYRTEDYLQDTIKRLPDILDDYWKMQKYFTEDMLKAYDDPSGIPFNWDGRRYDIPTLNLLQFVKGLFLIVYGIVVVPAGTLVILIAKYPFLHSKFLKTFILDSFLFSISFVPVFPFWVFFLLIAIILGPLTLVVTVMVSPMVGLNCMYIYYITESFKLGLQEAYYLLLDLDRYTHSVGWNFLLLRSPGQPRQSVFPSHPVSPPPPPFHQTPAYWNMFTSTCQSMCRIALDADWLDPEDVAAAMPSILTCVPAMAVLEILAISAERGQGEQVIYWGREEDAVVCYGYSDQDDLAELFWPKLMNIKTDLEGLTMQEKDYMRVKLCDVEQEMGPLLEQVLTERMQLVTHGRLVKVHRVCAQVNSLVLSLIRMKEMQNRLHMITNIV